MLGGEIIIEAVMGWPEGLSHGTQDPQARYLFRSPSLFARPPRLEGAPTTLQLGTPALSERCSNLAELQPHNIY